MQTIKISVLRLALLAALLALGLPACQPRIGVLPHITAVEVDNPIVALQAVVRLEILYESAGAVKFNWYASGGSFTTPDLAEVFWLAPAQAGDYQLMALLLDSTGKVLDRRAVTITVAPQAESMQSTWPLFYGTAGYENLDRGGLQPAAGGEFLFAASGTSPVSGISGALVARLDSQGRFLWQSRLEASQPVYAQALAVLPDGGSIVCGSGYFASPDWLDGIVVRLDSRGAPLWQKAYHLAGMQNFLQILPVADGGYLVLGTVVGSTTAQDALVLKLTAAGELEWCRVYGAAGDDRLNSALVLADGYLLGGQSSAALVHYDGWLLKIDLEGKILWNRHYNTTPAASVTGSEYIRALYPTDDGGAIAAGYTEYYVQQLYRSDLLVLKVDSRGVTSWAKLLGENGRNEAACILTTPDGGFMVAGSTNSSGGGKFDGWLLKLNGFGTVQWQKTFGDSGSEEILNLLPSGGRQYLAAGNSTSHGAGDQDLWCFAVDLDGYTAVNSRFSYIAARDLGQGLDTAVSNTDYFQAYATDLQKALVVEDLHLTVTAGSLARAHVVE